MEIKEKILFKTLTGSKLYGTNSENSDTDIKGVFLPDIKDLLLNKAPKHYTIKETHRKILMKHIIHYITFLNQQQKAKLMQQIYCSLILMKMLYLKHLIFGMN